VPHSNLLPRRLEPRRRARGASASALCALLLAGLAAAAGARAPDADAAPQGGAVPTPDEVLQRLNEARGQGADCGHSGNLVVAAPLTWSDNLAAVATAQSIEMAMLKSMQHRDSRNRGLAERLQAGGYRFSSAAENVAVGYPVLDDVVAAWLESKSHCENLMNPGLRELGLACVDARIDGDASEGRYWTLVLGTPRRGR
jgi:uncharacterized protein YkwD